MILKVLEITGEEPVNAREIVQSAKKAFKPWTTEELATLRRLVTEAKLGATRIYKSNLLPGRSLDSINGQMSYLGLGDPVVRERMKNAHRTTPEVRSEIISFLQGDGREVPNSDIASKFGVESRTVCYYRRKVGVRLSRKIAFSTECYREAHKDVLVKLQAGLKIYHDGFWVNRRQELIKFFFCQIFARRFEELKICATCGDVFFASKVFFYQARRREDGVIWLYKYCKACGLPWERQDKARGAV